VPDPPLLRRRIGLFAAATIFVGSIVGSGIFRTPSSVAGLLPSGSLQLLAWAIAGVLTLCGALTMVELAVAYPRAGGMYAFLRELFGPAVGFVYGWTHFVVFKPTSMAAIAIAFGEYAGRALDLEAGSWKALSYGAVAAVTAVNVVGVRAGTGVQNVFTVAKVAGIALLVMCAFVLPVVGQDAAPEAPPEPSPVAALGITTFALAVLRVFWAYDGWTDAASVCGEISEPQRTIPRAFLGGAVVIVVLYLVTNAAYLAVLTPAEMAAHPAVAAEAARRVIGPAGEIAVVVLVAVSTFGALNGSTLTGARVTLAMAADGMLWKGVSRVSARTGAPVPALLLQGAVAFVWLTAGGFDETSEWAVSTMWTLYGLGIAGVFVLRSRIRRGLAPAPSYRTPGFPVVPLVFTLVTGGVVAASLAQTGLAGAAGLLVAAAGIPVYVVWRRIRLRRGLG